MRLFQIFILCAFKVFRATANDKNIVTDVNMKDPDDILKNSLMIISLSINSSILKTLSTK